MNVVREAPPPDAAAVPDVGSAADRVFRLRKMLAGVATTVPLLRARHPSRVGHRVTALRSYGLWLRHAVRLHEVAGRVEPAVMIELGPGDSLGTSLAALLSGAGHVHALDAVRYADTTHDAALLDDLVALFRARAPIPDEPGASDLPHVDDLRFPSHVFLDARLAASLRDERVAAIRAALADGARRPDGSITYLAPWESRLDEIPAAADLVLSHSVLEYVPDLGATYRTLASRLAPGGHMAHFLDYGSIGFARQWDGHRAYSDLAWRLVRGSREYVINREPHSEHVASTARAGLELVGQIRYTREPTVPRGALSRRFRGLSDEDRATEYALLLSRKPAS